MALISNITGIWAMMLGTVEVQVHSTPAAQVNAERRKGLADTWQHTQSGPPKRLHEHQDPTADDRNPASPSYVCTILPDFLWFWSIRSR